MPLSEDSTSSSTESSAQVCDKSSSAKLQLISLSHTLLCFDLDSSSDAKQSFTVQKNPNESSDVAWRIRTNAPTRYIICPNSGVLNNKVESTDVTVTLLGNRFDPNHEIQIQSIRLKNNETTKDVWNEMKNNLKGRNNHHNVHMIKLELSTTVINFLSVTPKLEDVINESTLLQIVNNNKKKGPKESCKKLEDLKNTLAKDIESLKLDFPKSERLKEILSTNLDEKRLRLWELQAELDKLNKKKNVTHKENSENHQPCSMI